MSETENLHPDPDALLNAEQAAAILGVGDKMVLRLAREGLLPYVQVGRRYKRFRRPDLLLYAENGGNRAA